MSHEPHAAEDSGVASGFWLVALRRKVSTKMFQICPTRSTEFLDLCADCRQIMHVFFKPTNAMVSRAGARTGLQLQGRGNTHGFDSPCVALSD